MKVYMPRVGVGVHGGEFGMCKRGHTPPVTCPRRYTRLHPLMHADSTHPTIIQPLRYTTPPGTLWRVTCEDQRSHTFTNTARPISIRSSLEFRPLVRFTNKSLPFCMVGLVPSPDLPYTTVRIHTQDSLRYFILFLQHKTWWNKTSTY